MSWRFYVTCWLVGLSAKIFWDLNHVYHWFESLDRVYGFSIAIIILAGTFYNFADQRLSVKRYISGFFLYLAFANLLDELFFNPLELNWYEYASAILTIPLIVHYVNRTEKTRN